MRYATLLFTALWLAACATGSTESGGGAWADGDVVAPGAEAPAVITVPQGRADVLFRAAEESLDEFFARTEAGRTGQSGIARREPESGYLESRDFGWVESGLAHFAYIAIKIDGDSSSNLHLRVFVHRYERVYGAENDRTPVEDLPLRYAGTYKEWQNELAELIYERYRQSGV